MECYILMKNLKTGMNSIREIHKNNRLFPHNVLSLNERRAFFLLFYHALFPLCS